MRHSAMRMPILFDYNNDGLLDLADITLTKPTLYRQPPAGTFDVSHWTALDCVDDGSFANRVDVAGTSRLELLCGPRNGVYPQNVYNFSTNAPVNVTGVVPQTNRVNDVATADFNGDLRPDIFEVIVSARVFDAAQGNSDAETRREQAGRTLAELICTACAQGFSRWFQDDEGVDISSG